MEQTNLTPEQYKQLAEFAGHKASIDEQGYVSLVSLGKPSRPYANGLYELYTPDTNDSQAFELLRELIQQTTVSIGITNVTDVPFVDSTFFSMEGQTINLAICHAVLALEGEG